MGGVLSPASDDPAYYDWQRLVDGQISQQGKPTYWARTKGTSSSPSMTLTLDQASGVSQGGTRSRPDPALQHPLPTCTYICNGSCQGAEAEGCRCGKNASGMETHWGMCMYELHVLPPEPDHARTCLGTSWSTPRGVHSKVRQHWLDLCIAWWDHVFEAQSQIARGTALQDYTDIVGVTLYPRDDAYAAGIQASSNISVFLSPTAAFATDTNRVVCIQGLANLIERAPVFVPCLLAAGKSVRCVRLV